MNFVTIKRMIKKHGVKSWLEAGTNVVEVGDKLINRNEPFSRLDYYYDDNSLAFCRRHELKIPCGEITLNNGTTICYNVLCGGK